MNEYMDFAIATARKSGDVMRRNFSFTGIEKSWKDDGTPLTETDIVINELVISAVHANFPNHCLLGEERSDMNESEYIWVCDPIDRTIGFSHGYPIFMFQLALTKNGESILGVMYDPILNRMFRAKKGEGAFLNGKPIRVASDVDFSHKSKKAILCLDGDDRPPLISLRDSLRRRGAKTTNFYCASYPSALVACGEFTGEIYGATGAWDGATAKILVEEAGGKVTDLLGNEQRYDRPINGFVATNGLVHNEVIGIIKSLY